MAKTSVKEFKLVNVDLLVPYANNARTHSKEQIKKLQSSLREFGFINPLIIDREHNVLAGHGRLTAAKAERYTEVPCVFVEDLSEAQKKAYILADNRMALDAGWDEELLAVELEGLSVLGFDLSLTGFDEKELDDLFSANDTEVIEDDFDEEPPENPISKRGDIWLLGRHRLMCGDSTNKEDVGLLMNGNKADMLFTDPPYLMGFTGNVHSDGTKSYNAKHGNILNDKLSREDGDVFIYNMIKVIQENVIGSYYISFYRLGLDYIFRALDKAKLPYRSIIIWSKGNHTLSNSDYMSKYEPIVYGWVDKHTYYGPKSNYDIWDIPRTVKNDLHPTMKPLKLVGKALGDSSKVNNIILDLFGGSGSTLIASEQLDRICYMMELDEKYVDVILRRYVDNTGDADNVYCIRNGQKVAYADVVKQVE